MKMKTTASILLLLIAVAVVNAENETGTPSSSTSSTTITIAGAPPTLPAPPTTIRVIEPEPIPANMTTTTTQPVPTLYTANETNETTTTLAPETTTTLEPTTTTIEETTTTIPPIEPPVTTPPECGNLYQEVGEECDTTPSSCGAGNWECVNCKCVMMPEPTITTTTIESSVLPSSLGDVSKMNNSTLYILGGFAVLLIILVAVIWKVGGKEEEIPKTRLN